MIRLHTLVYSVDEKSNPLVVFITEIVIIQTKNRASLPYFLAKTTTMRILATVFTIEVFTLKENVVYEFIRTFFLTLCKK